VASPPSDPASVTHVRELIVHLRQEYSAFLAQYGDSQSVKRMWERHLEEIARFEAILR
jgi:hypothetical protein